jgi:hypothetical protein
MENLHENLSPLSLIEQKVFLKEIGIKKPTYYRYIKFLGIEKIKNKSGKICITKEQSERIIALKKYIKRTGKTDGFFEQEQNNSFVIKKESFKNEAQDDVGDNFEQLEQLEENPDQLINGSNALALREDSQLASTEKNTRFKPDYEEIYVEPKKETNGFTLDDLVCEAAELKTREMAMPDLIKRAIADKMEEEDLPVDLQEKLNLAREVANPKSTPESIALKILTNYRNRKNLNA